MASLDLRRQKIYRDTTIPLDGQSETIFDPIETATPSSKRKQVRNLKSKYFTYNNQI